MEDRRQLDPRGDHVLGRADARRCAPRNLPLASGRPASRAIALKMRGTWPGIEPLADPAALGDRAEQFSVLDPAPVEPPAYTSRTVSGRPRRSRPVPRRRSWSGAPAGSRRRRFPQENQTLPGTYQLGAPQHGVVGDGEQRPVAVVDQPVPGGLQQALAQRPCQSRRLALAAPLPAVHALERKPHLRALEGFSSPRALWTMPRLVT